MLPHSRIFAVPVTCVEDKTKKVAETLLSILEQDKAIMYCVVLISGFSPLGVVSTQNGLDAGYITWPGEHSLDKMHKNNSRLVESRPELR